ncbi:MAG: 6,7-dimethyl-8-ribityllumazine synthase [Gammaproteobacteria bacterium]|jgi:6,7-dimethyl-8-ribityllumazine synthase
MNETNLIEAETVSENIQLAIVLSEYNSRIVNRLLKGCLSTLSAKGIANDSITIVKVPGAYEIPVTVRKLIDKNKYDSIITLGAIIKGETPHFDIIANSCSLGISTLAIEYQIPIVFGVLTVNSIQQAMDRSGEEESNKGSESASTALEMIGILRKIENE